MKRSMFGSKDGMIIAWLVGAIVPGLVAFSIRADSWTHLLVPPASGALPAPSGQPGPEGVRIPFIENRGQLSPEVAFYASAGGWTVFVTTGGRIVHAVKDVDVTGASSRGWSIHEELVGSKRAEVRGRKATPTTVNYLAAAGARLQVRGVPTWQAVELAGIYPGVDLELAVRGSEVEKLFHVAPGARVGDIRVHVAGAERLRAAPDGRLEMDTGVGMLHFTRPVAYQESTGRRTEVDVAYTVAGDEYGFRVGHYDRRLPLTIDPLLASTFLGGSGQEGDGSPDLVREPDGDILLVGSTYSSEFPITPGAYDQTPNGLWDIVVVRLDSSLTTLKTATFVGGDDIDGRGGCLCLTQAQDGSVYVATQTQSTNFPTTLGAYDTSLNGDVDVAVFRLTAGLDTLLASTYLGGTLMDKPRCIALGPEGDVYVGGYTTSIDFPTTEGAFDRTAGIYWDGFLARFDANLATLVASTYFGYDGLDCVSGLLPDDAGNLYVAGSMESSDFPVTPGGFDTVRTADGSSVFIMKMPADFTTLLASTLYDGSINDIPLDIAFGMTGDIFITGHTASSDLPTTPGAFDRTSNGTGPFDGGDDVFIARFSPDLTTLVAATFLGGNAWEMGMVIRCDGQGRVIVGGHVNSINFPVILGAFSEMQSGPEDAFVCKLDEGLTQLLASTYLGGSSSEYGIRGLAMDPAGNIYVSGFTNSTDFPIAEGAYDQSYNGSGDWFISKLDPLLSDSSGVATLLQAMSASFRGDCIEVTWTLSEIDEGVDFEVLRAMSPGMDFALLPAATLTRDGLIFTFRDSRIERGATYRYQVRYHEGGTKKVLFETDDIVVAAIPLALRQNFPNPFNPSTRIEFDVPARCLVTLAIYDARGAIVRTLVERELGGGAHQALWDGLDSQGRPASSGIYFCRLTAGKQSMSRKLVLVR